MDKHLKIQFASDRLVEQIIEGRKTGIPDRISSSLHITLSGLTERMTVPGNGTESFGLRSAHWR